MSKPIHHLIAGVAAAGPSPQFAQPRMIDLNRAAIVCKARSARVIVARARRILKAFGSTPQPICLWVATSTKDLADARVGQCFGVDIEVFRRGAKDWDPINTPVSSPAARLPGLEKALTDMIRRRP